MKKLCSIRLATVLLLFAILCTTIFSVPTIAGETGSNDEEVAAVVYEEADESAETADAADEADVDEAEAEENAVDEDAADEEPADEEAAEETAEEAAAIETEEMQAAEPEESEISEEPEADEEADLFDEPETEAGEGEEGEEAGEEEAGEEEPAPVETLAISSVAPDPKGLVVSWNEITGAAGYIVSRRLSESEAWTAVADTTELTFTDEAVEKGKRYYYSVQSYTVNEEQTELSEYCDPLSAVFVPAPVMISAGIKSTGVIVTWEAVEGAEYYLLFRKADGAEVWEQITQTTDTSYVDGSGVSGTKYFYAAKAVIKTDGTYESGLQDPGISYMYMANPVMVSADNTDECIEVKWNEVPGADLYYVYRKTTSTAYTKIGETNGETSYLDKSAVTGTIYIYTVRAINVEEDGSYSVSYYNKTGISGCYIPVAGVSSVWNVTGGIKITWKQSAKANGYVIYRIAEGETKWKGLKYISGGSTVTFTDKSAKDGVTYLYAVRAVKAINTSIYYLSAVGETKARYRLAKPSNITVAKASKGFTITWTGSDRALKYRVYRKISGRSSWTLVGETTDLKMADTGANQSLQYYYTVVAINNTGYSGCQNPGTLTPNTAKAAMINKAQSYSSNTNYLILINCTTNRFGVFYGSKGNWKLKYYWQCTTGKEGHETCKGVYTINYKGYSFDGEHLDYTCYYFASFNNAYMIHSTLYKYHTFENMDSRLGMDLSQGCVRLYINNAKWIYENVPVGTTVVTYKVSG